MEQVAPLTLAQTYQKHYRIELRKISPEEKLIIENDRADKLFDPNYIKFAKSFYKLVAELAEAEFESKSAQISGPETPQKPPENNGNLGELVTV